MATVCSQVFATNNNIMPVVMAENRNTPERTVVIATPIQQQQHLPELDKTQPAKQVQFTEQQLRDSYSLTEQILNQVVERSHPDLIEKVLNIYRTFPNQDPILVLFAEAQIAKHRGDLESAIAFYRQILALRPDLTPVRIQLAISLFNTQQDNAAQDQFDKASSDANLPEHVRGLVNQYKLALDQRDDWQATLSANYLRDENVNNVSSDSQIEGTQFRKGSSMLPRTAHGIGYYFGLERDFNLFNAHYLHIENMLYGKNYWDAHDYDDVTNRTYLGYTHKSADKKWSVLPFYERQWYGNHRYKWVSGMRGEFNQWLSPNWQISTVFEYGKERYHQNSGLDGNVKIASFTLLWRPIPSRYFWSGLDFTRDSTRVKHYSYDLKTVRIGWGEEWDWGISSRLSFSASRRDYKDNLVLGSVFSFNKARQDEIYHFNATVWKRDWHLWGITPKLNYHWRKQHSNFDSLYSYSDKSVNVLFEKTF